MKWLISITLLFFASHALAEGEHRLSYAQLQQEMAEALVEAGAGDEVQVTIANVNGTHLHEATKPLSADILFLDFDERTKRWEAELQIFENGELAKSASLTGRYAALIEVPVLARRIAAGDVITEDDISFATLPEHRLRHNTLHDASELIGKSARRGMREGQPFAAHEVEEPIIVNRGDMLRLSYRTPYIEIQAVAEALEKAPLGKTIAVRNADSGQTLHATITAPGMAAIQKRMQLTRNEAR